MPFAVDVGLDKTFARERDAFLSVARASLPAHKASLASIREWLDKNFSETIVRAQLEQEARDRQSRAAGQMTPPGGARKRARPARPEPAPEARGDSLRADRLERALRSLEAENATGLLRLLGPHLPRGRRQSNALRAVIVSACVLDPNAAEWLADVTGLAASPWTVDGDTDGPKVKGRAEVCESCGRAALALATESCAVLGWPADLVADAVARYGASVEKDEAALRAEPWFDAAVKHGQRWEVAQRAAMAAAAPFGRALDEVIAACGGRYADGSETDRQITALKWAIQDARTKAFAAHGFYPANPTVGPVGRVVHLGDEFESRTRHQARLLELARLDREERRADAIREGKSLVITKSHADWKMQVALQAISPEWAAVLRKDDEGWRKCGESLTSAIALAQARIDGTDSPSVNSQSTLMLTTVRKILDALPEDCLGHFLIGTHEYFMYQGNLDELCAKWRGDLALLRSLALQEGMQAETAPRVVPAGDSGVGLSVPAAQRQTGRAPDSGTPPPRPEGTKVSAPAKFSGDYRSCTVGGTTYKFTKPQAACIRALWQLTNGGRDWVAQESVFSLIAQEEWAKIKTPRLDQAFRTGKTRGRAKYHPAWGTLIQRDPGRAGFYQVVVP